jgi:serine/threonine-protein phosphatase 2A regulatory subunit B
VHVLTVAVCFVFVAVVDVKPQDLQELNEVISACHFHPTHCNLLIYGTSRGNIRLADLRRNALCDRHTLRTRLSRFHPFAVTILTDDRRVLAELSHYAMPMAQQEQSFFAEIISSVSDVRFIQDGRYVCSRDYLTLKVGSAGRHSVVLPSFTHNDDVSRFGTYTSPISP